MITISRFKFLVVILLLFLAADCRPEWDGRSMDEILSLPVENATIEDLEELSRYDTFQLYYAADTPLFSAVEGEYNAKVIPPYDLSNIYDPDNLGPGYWVGKAFLPLDVNTGRGYNLFTVEEGGQTTIIRTMQMDTYMDVSRFDDKDSLHLVYSAYNEGLNHSMHDDIRKINDELFLGLGTVSWSLDTLNPMPFAVNGIPDPWVGPDGSE